MAFTVRFETPEDVAEIRGVHTEAFPTAAEAQLVDLLRADGRAAISLVAVRDELVIGHVMFSRMQCPTGALGLAPIAVLASDRRQGVAATLIRRGLALAEAQGWTSVFVLGDPGYYGRFGFDPSFAANFECCWAGPHLQGLALKKDAPRNGPLNYAKAFDTLK